MKAIALFGLILISTMSWAQINHPKASPFSQIEQQVGLSTIQVSYSRPAVKNRIIFGNLVPYGRIWRVGANESTKFTVDTDITVMGKHLPKGTYALYAFPEKDVWQVVFHKNTSHWGDGRKAYNAKEDAFRLQITPEELPYHQENFLISFDQITHNSLEMHWIWERTRVRIPITVNTHQLMEQEINRQLQQNPSAQTFYEVARYLQEQGKDLPMALLYLDKAIESGGDTYYFHRVRSLVLADLENYKEAILAATKSKDLAARENKDEFVRMNEKNIDLWKQQLIEKQ